MPFITFEGGEGSGKTTQIKRLFNTLKNRNQGVVKTREPGGCAGAEKIRDLLVKGCPDIWNPLTEALLMNAARVEHLIHFIRPHLEEGDVILCDRFADSTLVYQGFAAGVDTKSLGILQDMVTQGITPDLTFILDIDPEIGLSRTWQRSLSSGSSEDRFEKKGLKYHQQVREGFLTLAKTHESRYRLIDSSQTEDQTFNDICQHLNAQFLWNL